MGAFDWDTGPSKSIWQPWIIFRTNGSLVMFLHSLIKNVNRPTVFTWDSVLNVCLAAVVFACNLPLEDSGACSSSGTLRLCELLTPFATVDCCCPLDPARSCWTGVSRKRKKRFSSFNEFYTFISISLSRSSRSKNCLALARSMIAWVVTRRQETNESGWRGRHTAQAVSHGVFYFRLISEKWRHLAKSRSTTTYLRTRITKYNCR